MAENAVECGMNAIGKIMAGKEAAKPAPKIAAKTAPETATKTQANSPAKSPARARPTARPKTPAKTQDVVAASPAVDQNALNLADLAKGVLARDFRPRVDTIRRLAEAALAKAESPAKPKKKKKKKAAEKAAKSASGKKRRLAKIPGQKGKKKG